MNTKIKSQNILQTMIAVAAIVFLIYKANIIFSWFGSEPENLPVEIFHKKSPIDSSLNQTHIQNHSGHPLTVTATFYRLQEGMVYTTTIKLAPLERKPVVSKELWLFKAGDTVELLNSKYKKWSGKIP